MVARFYNPVKIMYETDANYGQPRFASHNFNTINDCNKLRLLLCLLMTGNQYYKDKLHILLSLLHIDIHFKHSNKYTI